MLIAMMIPLLPMAATKPPGSLILLHRAVESVNHPLLGWGRAGEGASWQQ